MPARWQAIAVEARFGFFTKHHLTGIGFVTKYSLMKSRWMVLGAVAASLAASSPAHALQPLGAFLATAHEHNFDRREQAAMLAQRRADLATARRALLPVFSAKGQYTYNQVEAKLTLPVGKTPVTAVITPHDMWDAYFGATFPVVDLPSWTNIHAASLDERAAVAQLAATTVDVDKQVARAFYDVLVDRALVTSAQRALSTDEANLREILVRKAAGTALDLDVERARAAVESSRQSLANAVYNVAVSERRLSTLSGTAPDPGGAVVEDDLHEEPPLEAFEGTRTPRELAGELNYEAARAVEEQTRRRLLPTVSATTQEHVTNATGFANQNAYFAAGVTVSWTFDSAILSQAASARAAAQAAAVRAARTSQDKDDDVYSAWMLVESQIVNCRAARANASSTRLAYDLARARYAAGTAQQLDLLQADRDAFAGDVARIRADGDLRYDRIALRLAAGQPLNMETP
jgi:outer membrane protein TolC